MGNSFMVNNNIETRNVVKASHKASNSLGNSSVINRIMYPITAVGSEAGNNRSNYGSVNSS